MKVLLSIKPEYVKKIFAGTKKYEYRKSIFNKHVDKVIVYATKPMGMIVGEFSVEEVLVEEPETLWKETHEVSGISKDFFDQYFEGRKKGYALKVSSPQLYDEPIDPFKLFASFIPPQSFKYIDTETEEKNFSFVF